MTRWNTVAIIGVGLIGGSIGLALRKRRLAECVVGVGRTLPSLRVAKRRGAVDRVTTDLARGVAEAELIVVCTPVAHIVKHARDAAAACAPGALITDAGSTKAELVKQLNGGWRRGVRFVGSHPLAGSEKSGPGEARDDLFENRVVVVTPTRRTQADDLRRLHDFWSGLGAEVVRMSPAAHDKALAATSHLPHLVASALVSCVSEKEFPLAAGGLRDTTRIAAADVELWRQIFLSNRVEILRTLDQFATSLTAFREALQSGDAGRLEKLLAKAKRRRDALGS